MRSPDFDEFVAAAGEFCAFAESDRKISEKDLWLIRELLLRLIYHIPAVESADQNVELDAGDLAEAGFHHAIKRFWQLPIQNYLVVFNPHDLEADDEPVMGMLSDDLSDIYRDLAIGMADFKKGYVTDACFGWAFSYRSHWARHAMHALGAIEIYRIDNYLKTDRS